MIGKNSGRWLIRHNRRVVLGRSRQQGCWGHGSVAYGRMRISRISACVRGGRRFSSPAAQKSDVDHARAAFPPMRMSSPPLFVGEIAIYLGCLPARYSVIRRKSSAWRGESLISADAAQRAFAMRSGRAYLTSAASPISCPSHAAAVGSAISRR